MSVLNRVSGSRIRGMLAGGRRASRGSEASAEHTDPKYRIWTTEIHFSPARPMVIPTAAVGPPFLGMGFLLLSLRSGKFEGSRAGVAGRGAEWSEASAE
jgi:hypothetical protein